MSISVKKAKNLLIESVKAMEEDLAQHGMTIDDWFEMMNKMNQEMREKRRRESRTKKN